MTEESTLPISAGEAASLDDAHRLFTKMRSVISETNSRAKAEIIDWPADVWWDRESRIQRNMLTHFTNWGRFTVGNGAPPYRASVVWGAVPDSQSRSL